MSTPGLRFKLTIYQRKCQCRKLLRSFNFYWTSSVLVWHFCTVLGEDLPQLLTPKRGSLWSLDVECISQCKNCVKYRTTKLKDSLLIQLPCLTEITLAYIMCTRSNHRCDHFFAISFIIFICLVGLIVKLCIVQGTTT